MNRVLSLVLAGLIASAAAFSPVEKAEAHHRRCRSYRQGHYGRVYYHPVRYYRHRYYPRRYRHYYYRHGHYRPSYYHNYRYRIRRHH